MAKIITIVALAMGVIALGYAIEVTARPSTGRQGQQVQGETANPSGGAGAAADSHAGHNH